MAVPLRWPIRMLWTRDAMCAECLPRITRRHAIGLMAGLAVAARSSSIVSASAPSQVVVADGLSIMPREAWAAGREPTGPLAPELDVRFLLVHHTASSNGDDPVSVMRSAYSFHTGPEKGWPDVAYNFFIDQFGVVWEGRAGSLAGPVEASATGGSQGFAQLVCLLGDFTSQLPTEAALVSLNRTLAWLAVRHGVSTSPGSTTQFVSRGSNKWPAGATVTAATISGHRDMSSTACPGDTFYPYLVANVPTEVTSIIGAVSTATVAPAATTPQPPVTASTSTLQSSSSSTSWVASTTVPVPDTSAHDVTATVVSGSSTPSSTPTTEPVTALSSSRVFGTPALVVVAVAAGAALAGAGLLTRRHQQQELSDRSDDALTGDSP